MSKYAIFIQAAGSYNESFEGFWDFEDAKNKKAEELAVDYAFQCVTNICNCEEDFGYYSEDDESEDNWVPGECECDWRVELVNDDIIFHDSYSGKFLNAQELREIKILEKKKEITRAQSMIEYQTDKIEEMKKSIQENIITLERIKLELKALEIGEIN